MLLSSESEMVISAFYFLVERDRMAQALRGALELNLSNHLTYFILLRDGLGEFLELKTVHWANGPKIV